MRILETKLFKYDELGPDAQQKARDWLANKLTGDWFEADEITERLKEYCVNWHNFNPKDVSWDYCGPVASFGALIDFKDLAREEKGGEYSHPKLRTRMGQIVEELAGMGWEISGGTVECSWDYQGPKDVRLDDCWPGHLNGDVGLRQWVNENIGEEDPFYQPVTEGLGKDKPDFAPLLIAFDYWGERDIDVEYPRELYRCYSSAAEEKANGLLSELEKTFEEWAKTVCRDLREMMVGEIEYQSDDDHMHELLSDCYEDWEFESDGTFHK